MFQCSTENTVLSAFFRNQLNSEYHKVQVSKAHHRVLINCVTITSYALMKFVNVVISYSKN